MVPEEGYEERMLAAFVQKPEKMGYYRMAWGRFHVNGIFRFTWCWSWWGFFGTWAYLLYRKAYLAAVVTFGAGLLFGSFPFFGSLIFAVIMGGIGPYFIMRRYRDVKEEIEATVEDEATRIETMEQMGGYHRWVIWVVALMYAVIFAAALIGVLSGEMGQYQIEHMEYHYSY